MHCCVCARSCLHVGGPFYCGAHQPIRVMPIPQYPYCPDPSKHVPCPNPADHVKPWQWWGTTTWTTGNNTRIEVYS